MAVSLFCPKQNERKRLVRPSPKIHTILKFDNPFPNQFAGNILTVFSEFIHQ